MDPILAPQNLKAYMRWREKPWEVDALLYERLPMVAVRNYISASGDDEWPLCWQKGRTVRLGLAICIESLKSWQAFRPGGARAIQRELDSCVPRVVARIQAWLSRHGVYSIRDVASDSKERDALIRLMARAVAEISACKNGQNPKPMLGSKVLHFFFPEFFPVWDTAWVKKAMAGLADRNGSPRRRELTVSFGKGKQARAAREYADYVRLMFKDIKKVPKKDVNKLKRTVLRHAAKRNAHAALGMIVDDNLGDLSPILFELCLIGRGRAMGIL